MPQTHTQASRHIAYAQRERLAFIEVRSYFHGDLTRAHIEERFGVKPAASARDLIAYRDIVPDNLRYNAAQRCYQPTASFQPVFAHTPAHVLNATRYALLKCQIHMNAVCAYELRTRLVCHTGICPVAWRN